eukprot:NODE_459_length_2451_cov_84.329897_g436_i0.p1 GENE.NODE_459_length_2451_cov_84.329897_g436_i0~~NODE_459_length_2451_cov_84.329897_g436_i0.p1  ORF type:complete len:747 (+),score=177.56 NODE_459_length_2451_cov_84.329897_g436_i0:77-2317(+)
MEVDGHPAPPRLQCYSEVKLRVKELIRGYFHQLTVGCGVAGCKNGHCKSSPSFQPAENNLAAFEEARRLAGDGFRTPKPVYYFCKNLHFPVDRLHLDVLSLDSLKACKEANPDQLGTLVSKGFKIEPLRYSFLLPAIASTDTEEDARPDAHSLDLPSLAQSFELLSKDENIARTLKTAMEHLATDLENTVCTKHTDLRPVLILTLWPGLQEIDNHRTALASLFRTLSKLSVPMRAIFVTWLSTLDRETFLALVVHVVQNFLTVQLLSSQFIEKIISQATITLGLFHRANLQYGGEGIIDYKEFYNDAVNSVVDIKQDYKRWHEARKQGLSSEEWEHFSFTQFPFILDPAAKSAVLQYNSVAQQGELQTSIVTNMLFGGMGMPRITQDDLICILRIDRQNLVPSALEQIMLRLESESNVADLKKPLRVQFIGEEGIDEGGVRKEFFQLLTNELFDPQFGMFVYDEASRLHWFNRNSFENHQEYRLIGIMFGLAIYNSVILEIRFPMVVYKMLLGMPVGFKDLKGFDAELYKGFAALLEFEETDGMTVEETFERTFSVEAEVYGAKVKVPLKENGQDIPLTIENRQEYVDLYTKYILQDSVAKQFAAFDSGFMDVCGGEILKIFGPEELELLICGSPILDFHALEKVCRYDGFTKDSPTVKHLWSIIHSLSEDDRKTLLKFCTGSDRVPIKGLQSMQFIIGRNGDDSPQLPTAHTCFNYLLLPDYNNEEKLREKLMLAMNNCRGFGLM